MTIEHGNRRRFSRPKSQYWVAIPLIASVATAIPAFPVSVFLAAVSLILSIISDAEMGNRKVWITASAVWAVILVAITVLGTSLWLS